MFGSCLFAFLLCGSHALFVLFVFYLCMQVFKRISISHDVRVVWFDSNTTFGTSGAEATYPSGAPEFTSGSCRFNAA